MAWVNERARKSVTAIVPIIGPRTVAQLSDYIAAHLDLRLVTGTAPAQVQLRWVPPDNQAQQIARAVTAARSASKVILFAYDEGSEGVDRGGSDQGAWPLPGYQNDLI